MDRRACFILILISVSFAVKANQNFTGKAIVQEKQLLPSQTFKSSSGKEMLQVECRKPCYPGNIPDVCSLGCECDMDYDAEYELYFCEPYDSGICSPCNFGNGATCPQGCGCLQIEGTSEYGCLPNQQEV